MEELIFKTKCHPEANGRTPMHGEQEWTLTFPLEDGRILKLKLGKVGREALMTMLVTEVADDLFGTDSSGPL